MILDGKALSQKILKEIKKEVPNLTKKTHLAVILVGNDPASRIYVNNKKKTALNLGIKSTVIELPEDTAEEVLLNKIEELNKDKEVTGILVQMPLPSHIDKDKVVCAIDPKKDVDCFTPENVGKLALGMKPYFYPVTPQGILIMLDYYGYPVEGKHVVVVGRSNIVGKPMVQMLLRRNATVTVCHSHTQNLDDIIKTADIIISAVGKKVVRCKMVKYKSVLVDVGISRDANGKLTGDLNFSGFNNTNEILNFVEAFSPVPGGVGPMTIASLMLNTLAVEHTGILRRIAKL